MRMTITFDEDTIIRALEANGWRNVWDIYWVKDDAPGWGALTTDDAFMILLRDSRLLPAQGQPSGRRSSASP